MKTWDELTCAYLTWLRTTRRAPATLVMVSRYIGALREFCRPFDVLRPADVSPDHVEAFEHRLQWEPGEKGHLYSASTVQQAMMTVRNFFRWLLKERLLLTDPCRDVRIRRVVRTDRRILTVDEVNTLLAAPSPHTLPGIRDRALLETLYGAGLRREECAQLDLTDVDLHTQTIIVRHGKNGANRLQPMGATLKAALEIYLNRCRLHILYRKKDSGALFVMVTGDRMQGFHIGNVVRKHGRRAGLGNVSAHLLRHAFATHLLQNGALLEEVQRLLGHELLASTAIYTSVAPVDVAKAHAQTHPRARRKKQRMENARQATCQAPATSPPIKTSRPRRRPS